MQVIWRPLALGSQSAGRCEFVHAVTFCGDSTASWPMPAQSRRVRIPTTGGWRHFEGMGHGPNPDTLAGSAVVEEGARFHFRPCNPPAPETLHGNCEPNTSGADYESRERTVENQQEVPARPPLRSPGPRRRPSAPRLPFGILPSEARRGGIRLHNTQRTGR